MIEKVLFTRKHNGEIYTIVANLPEYKGETGILNGEMHPHITIETPANSFGYNDYILFSGRTYKEEKPYTLYRYLQPYILKALTKQTAKVREHIKYNTYEFYTRQEWEKYIGMPVDKWEAMVKKRIPNVKIKYAVYGAKYND